MSCWNTETQINNCLPGSPMMERPKTLTLNLGGQGGGSLTPTPTRFGQMSQPWSSGVPSSPSLLSPMATQLLSAKVKRKAEVKDLKVFIEQADPWDEAVGSPAKLFMVDPQSASTVMDENGFLYDADVQQDNGWTEDWRKEQNIVEMDMEESATDLGLHLDWRAPGTPIGTPGDKPKKFAARKFGTPAATPTTPSASTPTGFFGYAFPDNFPNFPHPL